MLRGPKRYRGYIKVKVDSLQSKSESVFTWGNAELDPNCRLLRRTFSLVRHFFMLAMIKYQVYSVLSFKGRVQSISFKEGTCMVRITHKRL